MKKVYLYTLGCKVNQFETAAFRSSMEDNGVAVTDSLQHADIIVINTCAVTNKASAQSRQEIRRAARQNPLASLVVTGCHAQMAAEELRQIDDLDQDRLKIVTNDLKEELVPMVLEVDRDTPAPVSGDISLISDISRLHVTQFSGRTRAYLRVQDGCNSFCSYCIVPYTRGRSRSLPPDEVLSQAQAYARAGHLELVITGIHVGHYGNDLAEPEDLADLITRLCNALPRVRFRLSSIEPLELNEKILTLMKELDNFIPHLHIPLQSGDNEILARMNRRYSREQFLACIDECTRYVPDAAIGIDVMVGFPGESRSHFQNTVALLQDIDCSYLHVFPYSIRPGTRAAEFSDQVDRHEKRKRVELLRALDVVKRRNFYCRFLGSRRSVLIETERDGAGLLKGFSDNYIPIRAVGTEKWKNRIVQAELKELTGQAVLGHIIIDG